MDYKVLYRKYRPDDFSNIIGQDYMISILRNAISKEKISHAYIFSGPRGTGKTSTAKVFAKAINCLNPTPNGPCNSCDNCLHFKENADIIEIDAASNNGVEEIREIIDNIRLAPAYSKYKVYIIDEVHMLTTSAFNALLLTLEEPPKHVVFILATTNIEAVPITILSRCQRFDFHKIMLNDIINRLNYIVEQEKIDIDKEAIEEIAYISDGGMRDALSILDQLSSTSSKITLDEVLHHFGSVSKKQISDVYNSLVTNNHEAFNKMMLNFKNLAIDYKLLIKKMLEKIEEEAINSKTKSDYIGLEYKYLKEMAFELASISNYVNINVDPYILIEITLLKYLNIEQENPKLPEQADSKTENIKNKETSKESKNIKLPKINDNNEEQQKIIDIRINNCFLNAKKEYLNTIREKWPQFLSKLDDNNLLSLLVDSNIVASSDKIIILTSNVDTTVNLLNNNWHNLNKEINKILEMDYQFVALTEQKWQEERNKYINNIKNKVEYKYIEEPKLSSPTSTETETNDIEETAYNIFDKNKIEIE